MAKKIEVKRKGTTASAKPAVFTLPPLTGNGWLAPNNFWIQAIIVTVVGLAFYVNTYWNNYALDDDIIMKQNMYVQKGMSGIPEILTNDAYKSYYESMGVEQQLSGGRYRPLSIVTFAIEQSIFGECYGERATVVRDSLFDLQRKGVSDATTNRLILEKNDLDKKIKATNDDIAGIRHGFQVFWFLLSMVVLLWFLRDYIFRYNTDIAFLSVLLFTIHPIHTEVIANVKSRDEIFSLLFITLTFIYYFRYDLYRRSKDMWWGIASFFLALLSKEYAVVLIVLLPASVMLVHKRTFSEAFRSLIPFGVLLASYFVLRLMIIGAATAPVDTSKQDPLNDPYLYANAEQKLASKINRLDDYLWLSLVPYPLVSDYSYQHFPYSRFSDPMMWLSLFVNIGLIVLAIRLWNRRHPMALPLLIYLFFFALICNIFFDIGATMGERLIYHSSLGVCMALAWLIIAGIDKIKNSVSPQVVLSVVFLALAIPSFFITIKRNAEWRSDFTLFTADVKKHPNSALTNGNAGARYMDIGLSWLGHDTIIGKDTIQKYGRDTVKVHRYADTALTYLLHATELHKKYVNGWLNLGLCYYYKEQYELAAEAWGNACHYFPSNNILLNYEAMLTGQANIRAAKKDYAGAAFFLKCATTANPNDARAWSDYAGASFMSRDFTTAKYAFTQAINLKPELQKDLQNGINASIYDEKFVAAWKKDTMNADTTIQLAKMFMGTVDFYPESRRLLNHALQIRPNDAKATKLLDSLSGLEAKAKLPAKK